MRANGIPEPQSMVTLSLEGVSEQGTQRQLPRSRQQKPAPWATPGSQGPGPS